MCLYVYMRDVILISDSPAPPPPKWVVVVVGGNNHNLAWHAIKKLLLEMQSGSRMAGSQF